MVKLKFPLIMILWGLGLALITACGSANSTPISESGQTTQQPEPPPEYDGLTNPLTRSEDTLAKGARLYQANCASCHGDTGQGDGPAGVSLEPRPANLAGNEASRSDAYLFWRISKGGMFEPFSSMMPGWDSILREEQIWQVITYIRELG